MYFWKTRPSRKPEVVFEDGREKKAGGRCTETMLPERSKFFFLSLPLSLSLSLCLCLCLSVCLSVCLTKFISFLQSRLRSEKNNRFAERVLERHERIRIDNCRGTNATKNPSVNPVTGTGNRIACCEDTDRYPIAFPSNRVMQRACHIRNLIPTFVVYWTFQRLFKTRHYDNFEYSGLCFD